VANVDATGSAATSSAAATSAPPLPDTSGLKDEIRDLANRVDSIREDLEKRD
jgi:hypothetical protein